MSYFDLGNEQPVYIKDLELLYLMSRMTKRTQKWHFKQYIFKLNFNMESF